MTAVSVLLPVLHAEAWQVHMTEACLQIMRATTEVDYELVMVETRTKHFEGHPLVSKHKHYPSGIGYVPELNAGLDLCEGEYVVIPGNDIFMRPGWLEALLEPFKKFKDCGVSTLASSDLKMQPGEYIGEGVWGPLMCFKRGWRFDPDFKRLFIDTDLIMRIYEAGLRSYRNFKVVVGHLNQGTHTSLFNAQESRKLMDEGLALFKRKHMAVGGHLRMFHYLTEGQII